MTATIQPSVISGTITAPASKSSMQRACALAWLAGGETILKNPGKSNDDIAALGIIEILGAKILKKEEENIMIIDSKNLSASGLSGGGGGISCGESGLAIRMFTPIAALSSNEITISGEGSLLSRPMHFFDEVFPQLGVSIQTNKGHLPIKIKGPLQPADITIDGSVSSQFLTGLLMAFGKATTKQVTITVNNLTSKPYIDLTLQMMKYFGFDVENYNYEKFTLNPPFYGVYPDDFGTKDSYTHPSAEFTPMISGLRIYTVEGDWSSAAFLLVAGAIAGSITVNGLDVFSTQADKAVLQSFIDCGTNISIEEKQIQINAPLGQNGKAFHFNATDCPDLFPPLVVLAAYCQGTTVIEGTGRLLHKESNRALTLQQEFKKMGVNITLQDDLMMIEGGGGLKGAHVHAHHDHRIAMACAVAALGAAGETVIENGESVNKSYPGFYDDLKLLGANVSLQKTS